MKTISIRRPKEAFNKNYSYRLLQGKEILAELKNGEEKQLTLPDELNGSLLQAKIHWCGSQQVDPKTLQDGDTLTISGNPWLNRKLPLLGAMFPLTGTVLFTENGLIPKNIGIGFLVLLIVGLLLTLTVWKKQWLWLKKHKSAEQHTAVQG